MRSLVFLDGRTADPDTAQIRVDDQVVQRGDGVFETILVVDGKARELGPHLQRLARSAAMLDLPEPDLAAWERLSQAVIDGYHGGREMALKLVYTRGVNGVPTGFGLGSPVEEKIVRQRQEGVAVVTLERGLDPSLVDTAPWLLLGAKTLSYAVNMAAVREAERRGADDAVFVSGERVLEGPTSSVVAVKDRTLYTPPAALGILPGTTQAAVFRAAERAGWGTKVEQLRVADLLAADAVFLTSSVRLITRVHTIDGQRLPDATALHRELTELYEAQYA
ncbi:MULTISPECIES: aminodeoxychorismate lyase [Thermocrispum]|jgi:4-amino-4-deoxychorismate lyase|uniref:Aminodeoxychorismate lyase n=2 Tax=Thermocrispum agreste TaxID=37925 RepID=A0ABD6FID5_9PSEU|nr:MULTISPECIES: aminodeoxychorismate lyase [Thermocrispum]